MSIKVGDMSTPADRIMADLTTEGWSITTTPWESIDRRSNVAVFAYRGNEYGNRWDDRCVTVIEARPGEGLAEPGFPNRRLFLFVDDAGRIIRRVSTASGETVWKNPGVADVADIISRNGRTGAAARAAYRAKSEAERTERFETAERIERLNADTDRLWQEAMAALGIEHAGTVTGIRPGHNKHRTDVIVDREALASMLRYVVIETKESS